MLCKQDLTFWHINVLDGLVERFHAMLVSHLINSSTQDIDKSQDALIIAKGKKK
jgi:hypothetical protein